MARRTWCWPWSANGIATQGAQQSNDPNSTQVLQYVDHSLHSTPAHIGTAMEIIGFVAFAFFLGWLGPFLRRAGGPAVWLGNVAVIGGVATLAVKIGSVGPELALEAERSHVSGSLALLVYAMAGAGFVLSFLTFAIFMLGAGASILSSGALGRVTGWLAVLLGVAGLAVVATTASLDANPVPFLLSLVWILVVSVRLAWRGPRSGSAAESGSSLAATAA